MGSMIDLSKMKDFTAADIDGKIMRILVAENREILMIAAQNLENDDIYILKCEDKGE